MLQWLREHKGLLAYLILVIAIAYSFAQLSTQGDAIRTTQHQLIIAQHELSVSLYQSTQTRRTTVEQRCNLTRLLWQTAQARDPVKFDAVQLHRSYTQCEKQLVVVKKIASQAHQP